MSYDVIVIGAGAAGLMAAGVAAEDGKKVLLLEKMEKAGRKIRITGKGRCNLTNTSRKEEFLENVRVNSEFFEPSFNSFNNRATIRFFKGEGIKLDFERGGRVFPESGKAWDIADALVYWVEDLGVEIQYHTQVLGVRTISDKVSGVRILTRQGFERNVEGKNVIIATGGASYPATGSTGEGYGIAHELGHTIVPIRPALVPLESYSDLATSLNGINLKNVGLKLMVDNQVVADEFGEMNFGSRGIEGAIILTISRMAVDSLIEGREVAISIDMKTALSNEQLINRIAREVEELGEDETIGELMWKMMPKPMVMPIAREIGVDPHDRIANFGDDMKARLIGVLKDIYIPISDYRPFEEAVVTAGGISVEEIDPQTLQSKLVPGLYFAGEVMDIDANTGGYNLQVAFSTGHLAGQLKGSQE